jgi:hypothetical protein
MFDYNQFRRDLERQWTPSQRERIGAYRRDGDVSMTGALQPHPIFSTPAQSLGDSLR